MKIDAYARGKMIIEGKHYAKDLLIVGDKVIPGWWRKEGHLLNLSDLEVVVKEKPGFLVIGRGWAKQLQLAGSIRQQLQNQGIEVVQADTEEAVKIFNQQAANGKKTAGAFHLTC